MTHKYVAPVITDEDRVLAVKLVGEGYQQVSRAYRIVAKLPEGFTGRAALVRASGHDWGKLAEDACADQYRRGYATPDETKTLTQAEFLAFRDIMGKASWMVDWPFEPDEAPLMFGNVVSVIVLPDMVDAGLVRRDGVWGRDMWTAWPVGRVVVQVNL